VRAIKTNLDVAGTNDARTALRAAVTNGRGGSAGAAMGGADWLSLAAAPTFAIMALLAAVPGGGPADMLCAATREASPLSGMVPMYALMSAFHAAPWLKLISKRLLPPPPLPGEGRAVPPAGPCAGATVDEASSGLTRPAARLT
jgi:hypothetical protein